MARLSSLTIPLLTALLYAVCLGCGRAQTIPSLSLPTAPAAAQVSAGIRTEGLYETAPIAVDGVPLFRIATPANVGSGQLSVATREQSIDSAIAQVLASNGDADHPGTIYDPKTLHVGVETAGSQALLVATDAHHSTPLALLTVTDADAKYKKLPVSTLAQQWQQVLQPALVQALEKRQPAAVRQSVTDLWQIGAILVVLSILVFVLQFLIRRKATTLRRTIEKNARDMDAASSGDPEHARASTQRRRFMGLIIRSSGPEMQLRVVRSISWIILSALLLVWFFAVLWALSLFPQTTQASHFLGLRVKWLAIVVFGSMVLIRIIDITIAGIANYYGETAKDRAGEERARLLLRIPTIARALSAAITILIVSGVVLTCMGLVGFSIGSVLTLGGILALGITFAAQNLLRDFLNGAFVLIEDQYVVGDYVIIDEWSGAVEHLSLRSVQLRDSGGNLITIPHGQVTQVVNCSRDWSRVDYRVPIEPRADVPKAIEVLRSAIESLSAESRYGEWLLDPVELIGVDAVSAGGIVLRASIKTAPLRQFELKREINARVLAGFRAAGIGLGLDPKAASSMSVNLGPV
jgi:moderate conductance mechanosensitive channel